MKNDNENISDSEQRFLEWVTAILSLVTSTHVPVVANSCDSPLVRKTEGSVKKNWIGAPIKFFFSYFKWTQEKHKN